MRFIVTWDCVCVCVWGGGRGEGAHNLRFLDPLIPIPTLFLLAPDSLRVMIAKYYVIIELAKLLRLRNDCEMLCNFSLILPLPATFGIQFPSLPFPASRKFPALFSPGFLPPAPHPNFIIIEPRGGNNCQSS